MNIVTERNDRYEDVELVTATPSFLICRCEPEEEGERELFAIPTRLLVDIEFDSEAECEGFRKGVLEPSFSTFTGN